MRSLLGAQLLVLTSLAGGCFHAAAGASGLVDPSTGRLVGEASGRGAFVLTPNPHADAVPIFGLQLNGGYDWSRGTGVVSMGPVVGFYVLGDPVGMHVQLQLETIITEDASFGFSLRTGPTLTVVRDALDRSLVTLDAITRISFGSFEQWQLGVGLSFDRLVWPPPTARYD